MHARIQNVLPEEVQLDNVFSFSFRFFFVVDEGGSKYHYKRANNECWLDSFVIFRGIRTSMLRNPTYIFVIFQGRGGSGPPVPPSGSAHDTPRSSASDLGLHWLHMYHKNDAMLV